jgi:UDP-N-acetyl-D-glucosamine dehydrogenase
VNIDQRASATAQALASRIRSHEAAVGIIGLGYVGLPLAVEFARMGFPVVSIDVDPVRVNNVNEGRSYIEDVSEETLKNLVDERLLRATTEFDALHEVDAVIICVQTPFTETKEPDLSFVIKSLHEIRRRLHPVQLVVLQSTTYPGTTEEVALPILASSGLSLGVDFYLAFSPERVDPGNVRYSTRDIPKVVGGVTPTCTLLAQLLFEQVVARVYAVSSTRVAEMTKLLENVFRSVNIALVNELALLCECMNIDVWEVIDAAATKPFGFMPFYPGPGVGGHCIPVDPYYLSWKAGSYDFNTKLIALATAINEQMPHHVADRVTEAVTARLNRPIEGARILALGVAYKGQIADVRESPGVKVLSLLRRRGASIAYHDPYVARVVVDEQEYMSVQLAPEEMAEADCVVILTDHAGIDYARVVEHASLVFDTRNATREVADPHRKILRL